MVHHEQLRLPFPTEPDLDGIFADALKMVARKKTLPSIEARFYPYAGLSSTIRLRQGRLYARVSDLLSLAPTDVLYSLACILVSKLYRLKVPAETERVYRHYASQPAVLNATDETRRNRGYKITSSPKGKTYDLTEMFERLNARYFGGRLNKPQLSWSQKPARRLLGHHDHVHNAIIISRALDSPKIPRFVVEYVLYHEMLHVKHPAEQQGSRTVYHGRKFRADEKRFDRYHESLHWLDQVALPARRRRGRRRPK